MTLRICAAIDAPAGFLYEWWAVFWDIFVARTKPGVSQAAANYVEVRKMAEPALRSLPSCSTSAS